MPPTERVLVADFTVRGMPQPKQRARKGKQGTWYTPAETLMAERDIGWAFRAAARTHRGMPGQCYGVMVTIEVPGAKQVDLDNCVKLVLDGLNKIAWPDDRQVTRIGASKRFIKHGEEGSTRVVVHLLPERMPSSSACECGGLKSRSARSCRRCANARRKQPKDVHGR